MRGLGASAKWTGLSGGEVRAERPRLFSAEARNIQPVRDVLVSMTGGGLTGRSSPGGFVLAVAAYFEPLPLSPASNATSRRVDRSGADRERRADGGALARSPLPCDAAMARYAAGDEAAFAAVYDELAPRLFGYLVRQTRDASRAEDIVQQTFLQMHRARGTFLPGAEVLPWSFAIARRLMIDGFRRGRREVLEDGEPRDDRPAPDAAADDLVQAQEVATRIRRELGKLPETQRVAFELVKQEGLSLAEAAQVLGTTVSAVKLRAHRAYEALREVLGDVLGEEREAGARAKREGEK